MIKVKHKTLQKEIEIQRVLGEFKGSNNAPTLVFTAGIHGNETAGIFALKNVFTTLKKDKIPLKGNCIGLSGNLAALAKGERFTKQDLNRIWKTSTIQRYNSSLNGFSEDENEMLALYDLVKKYINEYENPFYFIDLHTTSSKTSPFITINDAINNRSFAATFPVPVILGIEEYLEGPFLSYINEFGHTSLGFEAGEHYSEQSIVNCEAFIWLALVNAGCIEKKYVKKYKEYERKLAKGSRFKDDFFEINYRYEITSKEEFVMQKGFTNFDVITKNKELATSNQKIVKAPFSGRIFMPLYQKQGNDGFFIITKISKFWLLLSRYLRKLNIHKLLPLFPGIQRGSLKNNDTIIVNPKTARFLTTKIFHLLGYRKKVLQNNKWIFTKRDKKIKPLL